MQSPHAEPSQQSDLAKFARFSLPYPTVITDSEIKTKRFLMPTRLALTQVVLWGCLFTWIYARTPIQGLSLGSGIFSVISFVLFLLLLPLALYVVFGTEQYRFSPEGYEKTNWLGSWCLYTKKIPLEKIVRVEAKTSQYEQEFTRLAIVSTSKITDYCYLTNHWDYSENNLALTQEFAKIVNERIALWRHQPQA